MLATKIIRLTYRLFQMVAVITHSCYIAVGIISESWSKMLINLMSCDRFFSVYRKLSYDCSFPPPGVMVNCNINSEILKAKGFIVQTLFLVISHLSSGKQSPNVSKYYEIFICKILFQAILFVNNSFLRMLQRWWGHILALLVLHCAVITRFFFILWISHPDIHRFYSHIQVSFSLQR